MKAFQNLKTIYKLFLGFSVLAVVIVFVAAVGYSGLFQSNQRLKKSYDDGLLPTQYLDAMVDAYQAIHADTYKYIVLNDAFNRQAIKKDIIDYTAQFNKNLQSFANTVLKGEADEADLLVNINAAWADYQKAFNSVLTLEEEGKTGQSYISLNDGDFFNARAALKDALEQASAMNLSTNQARNQENDKQFNQLAIMLLASGLIGVACALASGYVISRFIVVPLARVAEVAGGIASGSMDLSSRVDVQTRDEVGAVADAFNRMTERLRAIMEQERQQTETLKSSIDAYSDFLSQVATGDLSVRLTLNADGRDVDDPLLVLGRSLKAMTGSLARMITQMREAASALTTTATEILASTTQQAAGSSEQAASIAQTTTTVDEVKAIGEQAVMRAQEVADASNRAVEVYQGGMQMVRDTIDSMAQIRDRVNSIAENILALSEQTQQVGDIIATVSEIASQSNMLALNASVEAARAGEHGRGFAVVAGEVRSLAEQSRQATAQVKEIIQEIQKATNATVMATEEGTKVVDQGLALVTRTSESIEQLSTVINESAQRAAQVMAGGRQQTSGVEQIALAMQHINQATIQGLASTRQAERAAQDLNTLARRLDDMVKQYGV